ncbi:MAG: sigma 54-interacting transcriptional regulator [Calditrichaeota bacterium]|nr:sigma 54-interacting transcriptional regulator [Calditrichota bacterium]
MEHTLEQLKDFSSAVPDGIAAFNRDKKIIAFNEAAERLTGYSFDDIISKDVNFLFEDSVGNASVIDSALNEGKMLTNMPVDIKCADGNTRNFLASFTPIEQPEKGIIGIILVFRNTREMISLFQALQEKSREILDEKKKLEAIFRSRWEGTFTIDREWNITSFNRAAERITGYSVQEAIGRKCWEIFGSGICHSGCHMELTMNQQKPATSEELIIHHKDGRKVPIRVNSAPLYDGEENHIGAVETFLDISEIKNLGSHLKENFQFQNIIGNSKPMQRVYQLMENVIQSESTVLITGESGTGKELVARAIHVNSERKPCPFMAVNCSAFAETLLESELFGHEKGAFTGAIRTKPGRFEMAGEGTLFLDEIGDLSPAIQVKLLRVLESRKFERVGGTRTLDLKARIIAATNKNLESEVSRGRFREDLFYRVNVINIALPPLRERMEDLPHLVNYFLKNFRERFNKNIDSISPNAFRILQKYQWPGNIRELENVLEHAFVVGHGEIIETEYLPERLWLTIENVEDPSMRESSDSPLKNAEKVMIISNLKKYNGHRGKTARALGIDKTTLWRKMKKYRLL